MNHWLRIAAEQQRARLAPTVTRWRAELRAVMFGDVRAVLSRYDAELASMHPDDAAHVRGELSDAERGARALLHEVNFDRFTRRTP